MVIMTSLEWVRVVYAFINQAAAVEQTDSVLALPPKTVNVFKRFLQIPPEFKLFVKSDSFMRVPHGKCPSLSDFFHLWYKFTFSPIFRGTKASIITPNWVW